MNCYYCAVDKYLPWLQKNRCDCFSLPTSFSKKTQRFILQFTSFRHLCYNKGEGIKHLLLWNVLFDSQGDSRVGFLPLTAHPHVVKQSLPLSTTTDGLSQAS